MSILPPSPHRQLGPLSVPAIKVLPPGRRDSGRRISDLSCHLSTRKMRVRGRSEPLPPSYTLCARSISMSRPLKEGMHLERLTLRKSAAVVPSAPSGSPTRRTLFLLPLSSISVIFSVSHSSWFLKSVTDCPSIFTRRCLNRINAVTCLLRRGNYGLKLLS